MAKTAKPHPDDAPELTDAWFAKARPLADTAPQIAADLQTAQAARRRGKQHTPTKAMLAIRVDREALDRYRATGRGWQTRLAATIARAAQRLPRRRSDR